MNRLSIIPFILLSTITFAQDKPVLKAPVGLQLYSLRTQFQANGVPKTLDWIKEQGFKYVELYSTFNMPPDKFKALLDERGLVAIGSHFAYDRFKNDPAGIVKDCQALGIKYAGTAWIAHKDNFDEQECRDAIAVFNKAGKVLAESGITLFYHVHGYEFAPHADGTLFDLLVKETDPKTVALEMDVLWVVFPGVDPAKLLAKYPDRWVFTHLKDLKKGVKTGALTGSTDVRNDVPLGTGQVDYPAYFKTAEGVGIKYHFIEDESPTVMEQIPQTLKYLEQFKGK